jgi:hypothetical protein
VQLDNYGYEPDLRTPWHLKTGLERNARSIILKTIKGLSEPAKAIGQYYMGESINMYAAILH